MSQHNSRVVETRGRGALRMVPVFVIARRVHYLERLSGSVPWGLVHSPTAAGFHHAPVAGEHLAVDRNFCYNRNY